MKAMAPALFLDRTRSLQVSPDNFAPAVVAVADVVVEDHLLHAVVVELSTDL